MHYATPADQSWSVHNLYILPGLAEDGLSDPSLHKKKPTVFGGILIWSFGRAERWPNVNAVCCVSEQNGYCSRSAHGQLKLIVDAHLLNKFPNIIAAVLV